MATTNKGWGALNIALNGLVRDGIITGYETGAGRGTTVSVQVKVDAGADQANVLRQVRAKLPAAFSDAEVRTRL